MKIKSWAVVCKKYDNPITTGPLKNSFFEKEVEVDMIFTDKKDARVALAAGKQFLREKNDKSIIKITPCEIEI